MRHRIGSWERGRGGAPLAVVLILIGGSWALAARPAEHAVTRADLDAARRRVDRLEAEAALTAGRKPYIVLDLERRVILVRLMGMTVREILLQETETRGLVPPSRDGSAPEPFTLAGIFALQEKEGDPRLSPLTPEQIEAGLDDENAADTLPPEPPAAYALRFKQPVLVRVIGAGGVGPIGGIAYRLRAFWRSLRGSDAGAGRTESVIPVTLRLDETVARELYRTVIPGERWLLVPPPGLILPGAGQELPRTIRPPRPIPRPTPAQAAPPGVPFRIPPPVANETPAPPFEGGEPAAKPLPGGTIGGPEVMPSPAPDDRSPAPPPDPAPGATPPS